MIHAPERSPRVTLKFAAFYGPDADQTNSYVAGLK
jgi:hypothetical protein